MNNEKLQGLMRLNELSLTEDEQAAMLSVFDQMAEREEDLFKIDTADTKVMVHVMPLTNVLREDVRKQPFTRESLLELAPERSEDSWQVPRLVK